MQELEDTVSRLSAHKGVVAVLILNREGNVLVSSGNNNTKTPPPKQAKLIKHLMETSNKFIHALDPEDEISFVQIRSKQHAVMLSPHEGYVLAVLQDPLVAAPSGI